MKLLLPKTYLPPESIDTSIYFLGGPIRGGGDWQQDAARYLWSRKPEAIVVNPSRYAPSHPLYSYRMHGDEKYFPRQKLWERFYLGIAGLPSKREVGCVLFWLPCQSKTNPRRDGDPYARDTYGEIGEWRMRVEFEAARVVIGAEAGFPGLDQIKCDFDDALGVDFPIHPTLEATVDAAINMAAAGHFWK